MNTSSHMVLDHYSAFGLLLTTLGLKDFSKTSTPMLPIFADLDPPWVDLTEILYYFEREYDRFIPANVHLNPLNMLIKLVRKQCFI